MWFILSLAIILVGGHAPVWAIIKPIPLWVSQPVHTVSEWHCRLDSINKLSDNKNFGQFLVPISFSICSLDSISPQTVILLFMLLSSARLCNLYVTSLSAFILKSPLSLNWAAFLSVNPVSLCFSSLYLHFHSVSPPSPLPPPPRLVFMLCVWRSDAECCQGHLPFKTLMGTLRVCLLSLGVACALRFSSVDSRSLEWSLTTESPSDGEILPRQQTHTYINNKNPRNQCAETLRMI